MNENKESINKEKSTPLYPYDGRSPNLIDKFFIFGYNYLTLKKYLIDQNQNTILSNLDKKISFGVFQIDEKPSILSEIINDYNKEILDTSIIQDLIFPNNVNIYYRLEDLNLLNRRQTISYIRPKQITYSKIDLTDNYMDCPRSHRVTFSCNPMTGKNEKKCQNGFAYIFYRPFLEKKNVGDKKIMYYIPYIFCVISEYPFFSSYQKLFRIVREMFNQTNIYIPIEILLYKIIKLTPSPVNTEVILDLEQMCKQKEAFINYKNDEKINKISKQKTNAFHKENTIYKGLKNVALKNDFLIMDEFDFEKEENPNPKPIVDGDYFKYKLKFKYLSGYPLIQYNLVKVLFNTLSIEDVISTFFFTFLESTVLFFSSNIEYLTLMVNAFLNFNYPFNDAEYFYNIGAISLESFKEGSSLFGVKNCSSMIAINNKFCSDYLGKLNSLGQETHIIVDLDNQNNDNFKIAKIGKREDEIYAQIVELIKNICAEKNKDILEETILYQAIIKLYKHLKDIYERGKAYLMMDFIEYNDDPYQGSIEQINKLIQEAFYECVINLSLYCYENVIITEERELDRNNNNLMKVEFNQNYKNEHKYTNEEIIILDELKNSMKFESSFCNFVMAHSPIDLYKIPLTFFDEFISVISKKKSELDTSKINYFDLIDKLYSSKKLNEVHKFNFNMDIIKYFEHYKDKFLREIDERSKKKYVYDYSAINKVVAIRNEISLRYQTYELDDRILLNYIHIISNLTPGEYFRLISDNFATESNIIKEISITEIESRIDNFSLEKNYLSSIELCCANIIILFSISLNLFQDTANYHFFLTTLFENFVIFRKYFSLLLQMVYKLYIKSSEEKDIKKMYQMKMCFFACLDYIRNYNLIPNENLMLIVNQFLKKFYEEKKDEQINEKEILANLKETKFVQKITHQNLHLMYNFSSAQYYDEKFVVDKVNKIQKEYFDVYVNERVEIITPKIKYSKGMNDKIDLSFISQKEILKMLKGEYDKYIENLDIKELNKNNILFSCLNLFIFIRNEERFQDLEEIWKIMEKIFFVFLNI